METFAYLCHAALRDQADPLPVQDSDARASVAGSPWMELRWLPLALALILLVSVEQALALRKGDKGPEVRSLQTSLKQQGYLVGPVDGQYGSGTEQAVRQFQAAKGLKADGIAGKATLAALGQVAQGGPVLDDAGDGQTLRRGSKGQAVMVLQDRLREAGYYKGPVNGSYGPQTEAAVRQLQQVNGLTPDGVYGPKTAQALQQGKSQSTSSGSATGSMTSTGKTIVLRLGSRGVEVSTLQERLKTAGAYEGSITGIYDAATEAAVKRFQADSNLPVDGIAGIKTQRALQLFATGSASSKAVDESVAEPTAPAIEDSGNPSVLKLQQRLQERGFNPGPLDGKMGPKTNAAIQSAQRALGLPEEDIRNGNF
ncbi:hypothetical protein BST81_17130 [Leptolyngbya sp. 'hensonii']|uniref:peptidoglycan-binding domain-containing protein n=1 Tax=Leptolyngbya sp. 'hensonii' TaxID=1922337 RepID=UPI000950141B|nr:peptidoglycan-binding protein [Leptolyngbya sp. 'hensonii']OLP17082.1 hypothetical protein BST81_17130 [Leptolyngbya sp. 'hensonii']